MLLLKTHDAWSQKGELTPAFDAYGLVERYLRRPDIRVGHQEGWPSSQGVSTSDETNNSAQIKYFREVQPHKIQDTWSKTLELPPAFVGYDGNVSPPPCY